MLHWSAATLASPLPNNVDLALQKIWLDWLLLTPSSAKLYRTNSLSALFYVALL